METKHTAEHKIVVMLVPNVILQKAPWLYNNLSD